MVFSKDHISVVVIGHSDTGKSTVAGQLVYKCGNLDQDLLHKLEEEVKEENGGTFSFSNFLTKLNAEREKGEVAIPWKFETIQYLYTVIDVPGQRNFVQNMITGASQADVALLVVNASEAAFEKGFSMDGQTQEHALLAHTLGLKQMIVAVNKMEATSDEEFSEERFQEIKTKLTEFLKRVGYNVENNVYFVPVSGATGENIVEKTDKTPWYTGPPLIDLFDAVTPPVRLTSRPLRMPIQDVIQKEATDDKPEHTIVLGRIETGTLKLAEAVCIAPVGMTTVVKSLEMHSKAIEEASAGDSVAIEIDSETGKHLQQGYVLSNAVENPAKGVASFEAQVIIMNHPGQVKNGYTPFIDCHTAHVACKFARIKPKIDRKTGKPTETDPEFVEAGDACTVEIEPTQPLCVEPFPECPPLGRFVVRDLHQTIAVGVVKSCVPTENQS